MEAAMEMVAHVTSTSNSVKINEHQCKRLAEVYEEIGWQLSSKRIRTSLDVKPLLKVMEAGELLISQCAGPDWFRAVLVNAENKEAFEELHADLHLWFRTIFSAELRTPEFDPVTDAVHDIKAMLETLENTQKKGEQEHSCLTVALYKVMKRAQLLEGLKHEEVALLRYDGVPQAIRLEDEAAVAVEDPQIQEIVQQRTDMNFEVIDLEIIPPPDYECMSLDLEFTPPDYECMSLDLEFIPPDYECVSLDLKLLPPDYECVSLDLEFIPPDLAIPMSEIKVREKVLIGEGATAKVKQAEWLGMPYAVKIFRGQDERLVRREVELHQKLRSIYIVKLNGVAVEGNKCMILMELMDFNLHDLILKKRRRLQSRLSKLVLKERSPFRLQDAVGLMLQIAKGMHYLHHVHNILHGDLKTENVLGQRIGRDNYRLKISDFGISEELCTDMPRVFGKRGTSFFRAPEVLMGTVEYSLEADVYSFAMVSYEILTGRRHFEGELPTAELRTEVINGRRPALPSNLPSVVRDLVRRCWREDQYMRPSFSEIREELERIEKEMVCVPRRWERAWGILVAVVLGFVAFLWRYKF